MKILDAMKQYRDAGLCPVPVCGKKPMLLNWASVAKLPTDSEIDSWATLRTREGESIDGVGLVCGKISGGLICIDLDTKNDPTETMVKEYFALIKEMGGASIIDACIGQRTPSGGYHLIFQCPEITDGNQVFAKSDLSNKAVLETRGQGGQFLVHPSPGYTFYRNSAKEVQRISLADAELLFSAARAIDRAPIAHHVEAKPPAALKSTEEITPIDDYNAKATVEMMQAEIEAAGFVMLRQRGANIHYRRPGKAGRDTSETLHVEKRVFFVFTTSTDFEAGKGYSPAALLCYLHHRGDWSETARQLRRAGYGSPRNKPTAQPSAPPMQPAKPAGQPEVNPKPGPLIVGAQSLLEQLRAHYRRPYDPGVSLPWPEFDPLLKFKRPRLNLLTGIPGSGKSTWLNQVFLSLADQAKWRVAIFSPESANPAEHLSDLVEVLVGKPFFGERRLSEAEAMQAAEKILKNVIFIEQPREGVTFDEVLNAAESVRPDALLIDPWNRLMHNRPSGQTETEYIGECLTKAAAFAKALNLSFWIVAHPQKIRRDKDQKLIRPGLYDVAGSAHWANMVDVGIVVWRDYLNGINEVEIVKVRHKRDGRPGEVKMKFDKEISRFRTLTDGEKFLPPEKAKPETPKNGKRVTAYSAPSIPNGDEDSEGEP